MMKRTLIGAFAIALALIVAGCNSSQNNNNTPSKPQVSAAGINGGGTLQLTWAADLNAKSFEITAGAKVDTTDSTYFNLTTPVASAVVVAFNGSNRSDPDTVVCSKVVSSTVEFYNDLDTTHADGFGFDSTGATAAYAYTHANFPYLDFVSTTSGGQTRLEYAGSNASKAGDQIKAATGSYDSIAIADSVGSYSGAATLLSDSVYFLRLSANDTIWVASDNYAKMRVDSIVGTKVSVTTTYQTVSGLRWLK